jgi:hypothetical protein
MCRSSDYSEGWRPLLPLTFASAYPKLHTLIQECWRVRRSERPTFDDIVKRLETSIRDEIRRKDEPKITLYSKEDDMIYRNRIGVDEEFSDSDDDGNMETARAKMDTIKRDHKAAMQKVVQEMQETHRETLERMELEIRELKAQVCNGGGVAGGGV